MMKVRRYVCGILLAFMVVPSLTVYAANVPPAVANTSSVQESSLMRTLVVFPPRSDEDYGSALDETWWKIREELTQTQRFFIASKQFMQQKDVLQPRPALSPADAIILGKLLDAQALIVIQIEGRQLHMAAYRGDDGSLLWDHAITMHPSVPVRAQLVDLSRRLIQDFIASIPYQGFVVQDELAGTPTIEVDGKKAVKVSVGRKLQASTGDPVQFIRLERQSLKPLFEEGGQVQIIGEGVVIKIEKENAIVQVTRLSRGEQIAGFTLVRLPKEYQRLRKEFTLVNREALNPSVVAQDLQTIRQANEEGRPLATAISFISGIAAFLLLAL